MAVTAAAMASLATGVGASAGLDVASAGPSVARAAAAIGHIYWSSTATVRGAAGPGIDTVAQADLGGENINRDLIKTEGFPGAIAVDSKHVYWVNEEGDTIARANLNGSNVDYRFITRRPGPWGEFQAVLVHGDYIYGTQYASSTIGRARIDGTQVNPHFVDVGPLKPIGEVFANQSVGLNLTAAGKHLYWSDREAGGTIGEVDLNGTHIRRRFMVGLGAVSGLAADSKHLYWVNSRWGTIGRSDLSGRHQVKPFIAGAHAGLSYFVVGSPSIAVDTQHIYWTENGAAAIGRADLSGKEVALSFIHAGVESGTGSSAPASLAVGS